MLQILQNLRSGDTSLVEVPVASAEPGHILIRARRSLVSQGTEKMLVQFGKASLFQKARSQPDKVRQVLAKMRTDGIRPTIEAVFRKLDEPLALGYCQAGEVVAVGENVTGFTVGDRVASNGPHAEFVSVPANLVARVPGHVSDDAAAFTVVGAIGLQGIRLAKPELGETFAVIGLGLIGQITAQLLKAHGCRVLGFDFDASKVEMAGRFGIEAVVAGGELDPVKWALQRSAGTGVDGVIITASTSSNAVIAQSAQMTRKRGRVVLVGVVGLEINRADFYEKELTFQVSCSYGPGRYEDAYEEKGQDYPLGFVRWTENRNFQAVLQAMSSGALQVEPLITRRVPLQSYREIYDHMDGGGLASLLVYGSPDKSKRAEESGRVEGEISPPWSPREESAASTIRVSNRAVPAPALAIVGAGNFTKMTALPALVAAQAPIKYVVSSGGVTGTTLAKKYEVPFSTTDLAAVLADAEVEGIIVTTRHNLHAVQTIAALEAGKHVLVEKPLCLTLVELNRIKATLSALRSQPVALNSRPPTVTVGFNRRFSPHIETMKRLLADAGPISFVATMNAGEIPLKHWVHDPEVGGGRLIGEACHFVDLAIHLTGSRVEAVSATALGQTNDSASILLRHANGATSVVNYFAQGHRDLSKERVEAHAQGRSLVLDNFRELHGYGFKSFSTLKTRQDKGHTKQFALFSAGVVLGRDPLIPWAEIENGARATLAIPQALAERRWIEIDQETQTT